jgi:hypothetical protein
VIRWRLGNVLAFAFMEDSPDVDGLKLGALGVRVNGWRDRSQRIERPYTAFLSDALGRSVEAKRRQSSGVMHSIFGEPLIGHEVTKSW